MKRVLLLAAVAILGTAFVCGGYAVYLYLVPQSVPAATHVHVVAARPKPKKLPPLPDIDALAARIGLGEDIYTQVRDQALAEYAKLHPKPAPYDDEAHAVLRLFSYLTVWDDYYGEGLWQKLSDYAQNICYQGSTDPTWDVCSYATLLKDRYSSNDAGAAQVNEVFLGYGKTGYPAYFKIVAYTRGISNLLTAKKDASTALGPAYSALSIYARQDADAFQQLVEAHTSHSVLFREGLGPLDASQADEPTLKTISEGYDRIFEAVDRYNPTADALDGVFYADDAWNARGNDWGNTVTQQGWQLFGERLRHAYDILTQLDTKSPGEWMTAKAMMPVILGLQAPRDQMEIWFQKGIKADPKSFTLYMAKRWYLLPRWYGSTGDELAFGLECAKSDDWANKIPMMLAECLNDDTNGDPTVFARADVWPTLEGVYREFLKRYPDSLHYRSMFAKNAGEGGHWDIVREQLAILGSHYDPDVFEPDEFNKLKSEAAAAH